jgi:hypothetical protein
VSAVDGLVGTRPETINDKSGRWTLPFLLGGRVGFQDEEPTRRLHVPDDADRSHDDGDDTMTPRTIALVVTLVTGLIASPLATTSPVSQAAQTPEQRVSALKQSLADGQARLRKYEWIETTIISLKGEEKSRKQLRCYYGADGKLQKVAVSPAPAAAPASGGRGGRGGGRVAKKVVENKKDEMQDYMERAVALIHKYVPPNPAQIQKVKDAQKLVVTPVDGGRVRLDLNDYLQPGDRLSLAVNAATNTMSGVNVSTYLEEKADVVALDVQFGTLADGTSYAATTTLDAKAKNVRVVIQNTGHRPLAQ